MRRIFVRQPNSLLLAGMACVAVGLAAESASAQVSRSSRGNAAQSRILRPTVSPYLNLYRNDLEGLPTYQTLVRPQIQQQRVNQVQQTEIYQLRSQLATERAQQAQPLPQTGHASYYRYYSHYYSRKR